MRQEVREGAARGGAEEHEADRQRSLEAVELSHREGEQGREQGEVSEPDHDAARANEDALEVRRRQGQPERPHDQRERHRQQQGCEYGGVFHLGSPGSLPSAVAGGYG